MMMVKFELSLTQLVEWLRGFSKPPKLMFNGTLLDWDKVTKAISALGADTGCGPLPSGILLANRRHSIIASAAMTSSFKFEVSSTQREQRWEPIGEFANVLWLYTLVDPIMFADVTVFAPLGSQTMLALWRPEDLRVLCFGSPDSARIL